MEICMIAACGEGEVCTNEATTQIVHSRGICFPVCARHAAEKTSIDSQYWRQVPFPEAPS